MTRDFVFCCFVFVLDTFTAVVCIGLPCCCCCFVCLVSTSCYKLLKAVICRNGVVAVVAVEERKKEMQ